MSDGISRRTFLEGAAVGAASLGALGALADRVAASTATSGQAKVRIGKVYFGKRHPQWPKDTVDVEAERNRVDKELARLQPAMQDVEWIDCGLIGDDMEADIARAMKKLEGADGILLLQLTMGFHNVLHNLLKTKLPLVWFAEPFCGHEWVDVAVLQSEGAKVDYWGSSRLDDIVQAVSPIRAIRRLKDAKILYVSSNRRPLDLAYAKSIKDKFGTEIKPLKASDLEAAYKSISEKDARADAEWWVRGAKKVVEPSEEDLFKAARMALAVEQMVRDEQAAAITIDCLLMQLVERDMGYPCLGFSRLNSKGLGGICEADLPSTMTHLIFNYLVGRPGFVNDPTFDFSRDAVHCAHCVAATKMLGPDGPASDYILRSHMEDNRSVAPQVILPVGQTVSMAKLVGADLMLFSTGEAIDSPLLDCGCRTKVTVRMKNPEKLLENWSHGLHRVLVYGDHSRNMERFCRFVQVPLEREG